jgi:adenosylcobinamide hydrolase
LKGKTIGLMTAVPIKQLVKSRASSGRGWVEGFTTVGVTNAVRAGEWPPDHGRRESAYAAGTINIVLVTNVSFSNAAMVGAVQVATETKTGVLRDHDVPSWNGNRGVTATGTDAMAVACSTRGQGPWKAYSEAHTIVGAMIARVVADCMTQGLSKAKRWKKVQAKPQD